MSLHALLPVFAFVLFVVAAIPYPPTDWARVHLIAAGLACWVATLIF